MYRMQIIFSALALLTLSSAAIISPKSGAMIMIGEKETILWNSTGLTSPCDIHLVPANAKNTTKIIEKIASKIENNGSHVWTPNKTSKDGKVAIIIVDATKKTLESDNFILLAMAMKPASTSKNSTSSKHTTATKATMATASKSESLSIGPIMSVSSLGAKATALSTGPIMSKASGMAGPGAASPTNGLTEPAILKTASKGLVGAGSSLLTERTTVSIAAFPTTTQPIPTVLTTARIVATALGASAVVTSSSASLQMQSATASSSIAVFKGAATRGPTKAGAQLLGSMIWLIVTFLW